MARKKSTGIRKPMSEETREKIAAAVRAKAREKRIEAGLPADGVTPQIPDRSRALELVQMKDQQFDPDLFVPMPTGRAIDQLFTLEGGLPKATNYMVVGDPGVGKSTVTLDILSDLIKGGYKCLFISAEMTRIDLYKYVQRYPSLAISIFSSLGNTLTTTQSSSLKKHSPQGTMWYSSIHLLRSKKR